MSGNSHARMVELLDEAQQTYFNALKTGMQLQEDVTGWWSQQFKAMPNPAADFDPQAVTAQAMQKIQENAEKQLAMMEAATRQSVDLLNQAFTVGQADSLEAGQAKLRELWESSMQVMRSNLQAMVDANTKMVAEWSQAAAQCAPTGQSAEQ